MHAEHPRRLLVLDTSYALDAIRAKRLEASVTCRDLNGYFDEVWTVHPFATLVSSPASGRYGRPVETRLDQRHVFVEGKVGRFGALAGIGVLNFLIAQLDMLYWLIRLVRRRHISVVRAGDPLLLGLYGWVIARICGIPLVVRVGGNNEKVRQETGRPIMPRLLRSQRLERGIERFVLSRADLVAGANQDNLRYAMSMGARPDKSTLFRYGNLLDPIHFVAPALRPDGGGLLEALGLRDRRFLLSVGRLEPVKMPGDVLRAFAAIRSKGSDVWLLMVGGGSMLGELQALASRSGVADRVVFAGERDQAWLGRVIPRAAVALSPHTGRALCEVALAGLPTVAYDIDWQNEIIVTGVSGALVDKGDVEAMAREARSFLSDGNRARRIGTQLRETALDMMDTARLDAHERNQYDRLLRRVSPAMAFHVDA